MHENQIVLDLNWYPVAEPQNHWEQWKPFLPKADHAWVERLLFAAKQGPIIDSNLSKIINDVNAPRPTTYGSLESSSWNLNRTIWMDQVWDDLRRQVVEVMMDGSSNDEQQAALKRIKESVLELLNKEFRSFFNLVQSEAQRQGMQLSDESVILTQSGADALVLAGQLLSPGAINRSFSPPDVAATTKENGSGVRAGLHHQKLIEIDVRDHEGDGSALSQDRMAAAWIEALDRGATFVSLTAVTKTGIDYTVANGAVMQVLDYIQQRQLIDRVCVVIDCVQLIGRLPFENALAFLKHPAVAGIVHSGSKAAGGSPHAGVLLLSQLGLRRLEDLKHLGLAESDGGKKFQGDLTAVGIQRSMIFAPFFRHHDLDVVADDLLTSLRAADNMQALAHLLATPESHQLYGLLGRQVEEMVLELFKNCGFSAVPFEKDGKVPSIVALYPPDNLSPGVVKDQLIPKLRGLGIEIGGYLQEGNLPILRCTVNRNWFIRKDGSFLDEATVLSQVKDGLQEVENRVRSAVQSLIPIQ